MIRNIIFDIGNVLLSFKPDDFLLRFTEDQDLIRFFIHNVIRSKTWLNLDRGSISIESARNDFLEQFPEKKSIINLFFDDWTDILIPIQQNVQIVKDLKDNGYDCYFLSNFIEEAYTIVIKKFDFFTFFNGGIISSLVKAIKPEIKIYSYLLRKYKLNPKECLFIDDIIGFLRPARRLGFTTIHYTPKSDLRQELNNLGIII